MSVQSFVKVLGPPERVQAFEQVFGSDEVPVKELLPIPQETSIPAGYQGRQVSKPCYFLDLAALTDEQRDRLIEYSMAQFGMSREECEYELPKGFPILAEETIFTTNAREFL